MVVVFDSIYIVLNTEHTNCCQLPYVLLAVADEETVTAEESQGSNISKEAQQ